MLLHFKKLDAVDQLFAILRVLVIVGGISWILLSSIPKHSATLLFATIAFFCIYSIILYVFIFLYPPKIQTIYNVAFYLDVVFLFFLVRLTGGFNSSFFLGFLLLIALHSFYFGLNFGIRVAVLSTFVYLLAGDFALGSANYIDISLRLSFFFLVGVSMGLVARKETLDKQRIQKLNDELEEHRMELEQEKDKLSMILTGIDAGLVLLDKERQILWANRVTEDWFNPLERIKGKNCNIAIWGNDEVCKDCPAQKSLITGKLENCEVQLRKDDTLKHYRITAAPLFNENGGFDRILELIQDITQEKELQSHLIHSSKFAAIGELASGIAHEINNPLGSIAVCAKEISDALNTDNVSKKSMSEIKDCLGGIKEEINRCKRITTGLLQFARKSVHRRIPVDINQLLESVIKLVRYNAESHQKKINLHLTSKLLIIMGDEDELTQVFLNLILNAQDFTPPGGSIDIYAGRKDADHIYVYIQDEGCGIPPQNLHKIFNPFFTTKPAGSGTGLGLPISLRIIEAHGGQIKVDSQIDKGTKMSVILPSNREAN